MSSFFTFALVVIIISLILLALSITNIVYYNQFKSGVALTTNQLRTLRAINIIALIMLFVIFIYSIFIAIQARRVPEVSVVATSAPAITTVSAVPALAPPIAPAVVVSNPPVAGTPAVAIAPQSRYKVPTSVMYAGKAVNGTDLYRATTTTTVEPGQYICRPPDM